MSKDSKDSLVYGMHAVHTLLQQNLEHIKVIYVQAGKADQRLQKLLDLATQQQIVTQTLQRHKLDAMVNNGNHQGIIAVATAEENIASDLETFINNLNQSAFLLILDGVQDPHNLGACLRSANATGVHAVIAPKDRAVGLTPVVRKVASGAAEITPFIQVTNLARAFETLKENGVWIYGAAEEAEESIYTLDLTGPIALVLGAEGSGLRRLTRERCDKLMRIPTVGQISSLNVSVAAGVCLFEALRQRSK